jgi:hypothetical protein
MSCALVLAMGGCSIVATHEEYAAYRAIRTAQNDDERLTALASYAEHYPNGYWAGEVQADRDAREDDVWRTGNATREGLEHYLAVYPDGHFAEQAHARLAAVTQVSTHREVEQEHVQEVVQQTSAQAAEERRQWVTRAATFWERTLLAVRNYGQPIGAVARANPEFSQAFGQAPAPMCTPDHCIKHYHSHYAIPVPGGTRIERDMQMFLRIRMESGRVERVEVLLPNKGFSRWFELENRTLVTDEDPEQRAQALEWALQRLAPALAEVSGAHAIDVIPEPIDPITSAESTASERAEEGDDAAAEPTPPPVAESGSAPSDVGAPPAEDSLEALLAAAAGVGTEPTEETTEVAPIEDSGATMVLPIGLQAIQVRNVRMVIFAAGDEDYGEGFDGFYIERVRD